MPITKYILKNTRRQAAVKIVSDGQLNNTITYTDIKYADQTIPLNSAGNLVWTISDIVYDVASHANIVRNGNVVFTMSAGQGTVSLSRDLGVVLDEQAHANVTVHTGTGNSSVILQFTKGAGFNDPDRQNLQQPDR
jgi:phage baseplate assembly protein gpV